MTSRREVSGSSFKSVRTVCEHGQLSEERETFRDVYKRPNPIKTLSVQLTVKKNRYIFNRNYDYPGSKLI